MIYSTKTGFVVVAPVGDSEHLLCHVSACVDWNDACSDHPFWQKFELFNKACFSESFSISSFFPFINKQLTEITVRDARIRAYHLSVL